MDKLTEAYNKIKEAREKREIERQNELIADLKFEHGFLFEIITSVDGSRLKIMSEYNQINLQYGEESIVCFADLLQKGWVYKFPGSTSKERTLSNDQYDKIIVHVYENIMRIKEKENTKTPERPTFSLDQNIIAGNEDIIQKFGKECKYCPGEKSVSSSCNYCGRIF